MGTPEQGDGWRGWPDKLPTTVIPEVVARAGNFIKGLVRFFPADAPDFMSDHNRGAAAMLDDALDGPMPGPDDPEALFSD